MFTQITNFMRNSSNMSFFLGESEDAKLTQNYET